MAVNVWKIDQGVETTTQRESQVATAAQVIVNISTFTYIMGANLQVFVNGVKQILGVSESYIETSTTSITFNEGLDAGDLIELVDFV